MEGHLRPKITENDFNKVAEGLRKLVEKLNIQRHTEQGAAREAATRDLRDFLEALNRYDLSGNKA